MGEDAEGEIYNNILPFYKINAGGLMSRDKKIIYYVGLIDFL